MDVSSLGSVNPWGNSAAVVGVSAGLETPVGAASLESPTAQQTQSEIRSLAAEIAQLAHSQLEPDEFFGGFLPRLCSAMGAKGAGVWCIAEQASANSPSALRLLAEHSLPASLLASPKQQLEGAKAHESHPDGSFHSLGSVAEGVIPSVAHQKILLCVAAEGQPILVPPASVQVEIERPHNPLSDALIVIPVRVQTDVEYLLEVVQRPSGGPATQRGYLRFVAQMADLMADYLRRQKLRVLTHRQERLHCIERWLTTICSASTMLERQQLASDALRDLVAADRVILLSPLRRGQVLAISGARSFDPRSEIVIASCRLLRHAQRSIQSLQSGSADSAPRNAQNGAQNDVSELSSGRGHSQASLPCQALCFNATNRRNDSAAPDPMQARLANGDTGELQSAADEFCHATACRHVIALPLDPPGVHWALIAYAEEATNPGIGRLHPSNNPLNQQGPRQGADESTELRLISAIGGLLAGNQGVARGLAGLLPNWLATAVGVRRLSQPGLLSSQQDQRKARRERRMARIARVAIAALLIAIACFPVTQQIAATAILQPVHKQMYYAPAAAVVSQVLIAEEAEVQVGTPLLQLTSHDLEAQVEGLQIELSKTHSDIAEKTRRLNRGEDLSDVQRDQLEFNLRELDTTLRALEIQRDAALQRVQELTLHARAHGMIATWDLQNRLLHHPVQAGELLVSSFDPAAAWRLQLAIPDYRAGLVSDALRAAENRALPVRFSLASHPDQVLEAFAVNMAPQVTVQGADMSARGTRVVRTEAVIRDADLLPLKKDGAVARASIDCGTVPLVWLVFRDALWAISSRVRMIW